MHILQDVIAYTTIKTSRERLTYASPLLVQCLSTLVYLKPES